MTVTVSFSGDVANMPRLCTSGFVDDDVFSHNGSMARCVYFQAAIEYDKQYSRDFSKARGHTAMWACSLLFLRFTDTNVYATVSIEIRKTRHRISVDIRILVTV